MINLMFNLSLDLGRFDLGQRMFNVLNSIDNLRVGHRLALKEAVGLPLAA